MVSYRWSLETVTLSRVIAEILCDKHLGEHIPIENALIAIFGRGDWELQHFTTSCI